MVRRNPVDRLLAELLPAGTAVAGELRRRLIALTRRRLSPNDLLRQARELIARHEPLLERAFRDALLASYLTAARQAARPLPDARPPWLAPPGEPPRLPAPFGPGEPEPVVRLPLIERAAADLAGKRILLQPDFDALAVRAQKAAFTVARVTSLDTLKRVQMALVDNVAEGGTLRDFRRRVETDLAPVLAPHQVEALYRTHMALAYSAGQRAVLRHPLVRDEFPYVRYVSTRDTRVRREHARMEHLGLNRTAVYRVDDPTILKLWPPWGYRCRCHAILISIEDAAALGVEEAKEWLRTGRPPAHPHWVNPPPYEPPPGWPTASVSAAL